MAIVINDFEIVVEPPAPASRGGAGGEQQQAQQEQPPPDPGDIIAVARLHAERMERLRAD